MSDSGVPYRFHRTVPSDVASASCALLGATEPTRVSTSARLGVSPRLRSRARVALAGAGAPAAGRTVRTPLHTVAARRRGSSRRHLAVEGAIAVRDIAGEVRRRARHFLPRANKAFAYGTGRSLRPQ